MAWWAALAPIVGGAIDWLTGQSSHKKAGKTAYQENYQGLMGRVEASKALGLHPTAALGGSFTGSGAFPQTNFGDLAAQGMQTYSNYRQHRAEAEMRRQEEQRRLQEAESQRQLQQAQIQHIQKQSEWIDEQIKDSEMQRLRQFMNSTRVLTPFGGVGSRDRDAPDVMTEFEPHRVTRHRGGITEGVGPSRELVQDTDGTVYQRPHGAQAEQSEIMNFLQDLSAHYGIPITEITGGGGKITREGIYDYLTKDVRRARELIQRFYRWSRRKAKPRY